jgi:ABC-2 type transport system ATP-binding protein
MNAIKVEHLKKSYLKGFWKTKFTVIKDLSFSVEAGKITGFLGSNGTGKTTTLKCLLNLALPDSGSITFFDEGPLTKKICKRIGFLPEHPYFYQYLTGAEFLKFYGQISTSLTRVELNQRVQELLKKVHMDHAADRAIRTYSKGMLQRIGLAQALIHRPELVILDEPMAGLDPDGRIQMAEIIIDTAKMGSAIFFSSHLLHDAETLCENLVILSKGSLVYQGPTQKLLNGLQTGFRLTTSDNGRIDTAVFSSSSELQKAVDLARQKKQYIEEVRAERPSLEAAFAKISKEPQV